MRTTDPDLRDVLFLDRHPGWTWRDLQETPDDIVAGLRLVDSEHAKHQ